jgi:hypothetical protein
MQFPGVVGNDGIGEEGQRAADHDFLIPSTPAIDANRTRVNDALKLVDGFPADQYAVDAYRSSSRRVTGGEPSRCQNPTIAEAVDTGIFCPKLVIPQNCAQSARLRVSR